MTNPIKYTSRTFNTALADINADPELADKPNWWKRVMAGILDVLSMINNGAANNAYLRTAFTRQAVKDLCNLIGYDLAPQITSSGTLLFYFPANVTYPFTVLAKDLVATTRGSITAAAKRFESRSPATFVAVTDTSNLTANPPSGNAVVVTRAFTTGEKVRLTTAGSLPTGLALATDYYVIAVDATHVKFATTAANAYAGMAMTISGGSGVMTLRLYSGIVTAYQQLLKAEFSAGTSDGITPWQEYAFPDLNVLRDTLVVKVNSVPFTRVDNMALSGATDKVYQLVYNTDQSSLIRFGNGTYGEIPGAFEIMVTYAIGGGADSNVSVLGSINVYAGSDANVSGVSNPIAFTGGADPVDIQTAKEIAPGTLKTRDRFITIEDGESLILAYGGITQTHVIPNVYGTLSCQVVGIATGGGNPSAPLKAAIQAYLISRSILDSMDVRFTDAVITAQAVTSVAKMLPGYSWTIVQPYFRLAWKLILSEAGKEISTGYLANGIAYAVSRINAIFGESFSVPDYAQVAKLIGALPIFGPRNFGETVQLSDVTTFIQSYTDGIDYMTVALPSFPITLADDEITTYGTLNLSEIM